MAGRGRAKRAGPVSIVGRTTPRTNFNSVYKGGNKIVGGGYMSKIPVGPNPKGAQARRVRNAAKKR